MRHGFLTMLVVVADALSSWAGDHEPYSPFQIDIRMGLDVSGIDSKGDIQYVFEPTSNAHSLVGYDWGIEGTVWLARYLGLTSGLDYQKNGMATDKTDVRFTGDPAVHALESLTELYYLSIPVQLRLGYLLRNRHHVTLRLGPEVSIMTESKATWTVDGQTVNLKETNDYWVTGREYPTVAIDKFDLRFALGVDYFYRLGTNGLGLSAKFLRGLRDIVKDGPSGETRLWSWTFSLGYRRYF